MLLTPFLAFSQQKEEIKKEKKVNYAFIPLVMYNSSLGWQLGIMANSYFKMNKKDTISPASSIGFFGSYYTSHSYMSVLYSKMHFKEDNYRTKSAIGYGNINFQNYIEYSSFPEWLQPVLPDDGFFMDYTTQFFFAYAEGMKKVWNKLYVGGHVMYNQNKTTFFLKDKQVKTEENTLLGIGLATEFDNRDNVFNPSKGQNIRLGTMSFLEALGSSSQYHRIKFQYNKYFNINSKTIILARTFGVTSFGGDVPFSGKNVVGQDDLRGYSNGKFRANQVYDIQTELRWNFYKKWGLVGFGGVAIATDDFSGNNYSGLLPAIGMGIRFKAIESKNINIGIDVAKGVNDWGVYFRIGEAFTK